ncbi:hypothetical protein O3M35_008444 [Rhynocoris fuscipes]|uniref:Uncharacterized protein n=1 Tax=Rhynocoris fuscipes TaxID=488301 RepID=A0AAW1D7S3_9HEMI
MRQKTLQDEESKRFINEAESTGKKIFSVLFILLPCYPVVSFILNSISEVLSGFKKRRLLFKQYLPWSRDEIWIHVLSNALTTAISFLFISVYFASNFMEVAYTLYTSAYIKSLQNKLINKGLNNKEVYEHHKVINQLLNDYSGIWSILMYIQILICPLMPCGFVASSLRALQRSDIKKSFENLLRAFLCLLPCLISCCCGQIIITQMEKLHEASYMNKWYEEKPKVRNDALKLMTRTSNIASVNYRLFTRFDHVLLGKVLQVIYSYTMLMVNLE